jgi:hypothetical protein
MTYNLEPFARALKPVIQPPKIITMAFKSQNPKAPTRGAMARDGLPFIRL